MQKVPIYGGFLKTAFGSATLSATQNAARETAHGRDA
jgi:hypothetical protein